MQLLPVRGLDDLDLNPPRLMIEVDENLRCRRETAASPGCRPRRSEAGERAAFEIGAYRREAESRGEVDGWHCHDGLVVAREASERNAIHAVTVPFVELDVPAIELMSASPAFGEMLAVKLTLPPAGTVTEFALNDGRAEPRVAIGCRYRCRSRRSGCACRKREPVLGL